MELVLKFSAQLAVPNNDPVIDPDTITEPVTWKVLPDANTKFDLLLSSTPFPIIKADCAEDEMLY